MNLKMIGCVLTLKDSLWRDGLLTFQDLKAAIINIFLLTMDQMTTCNVKGVSHSDEPTENYHPAAVPLSSS